MFRGPIPAPHAPCPLPASEQVNTLVSEAFVQFFVRTVGHYASHIKWSKNGSGTFQERAFCKAIASKTNRKFVKKFVKTNMFSLFIEEAEKSRIPQEGKRPRFSFPLQSSELCEVLGYFIKGKRCPMPGEGCSSRLGMLRAASSTRLLSTAAFLCPCQAIKKNPWADFRSCCLPGERAGLRRAQCLGKYASSSANIWLGRRQQLGAGSWLRCLRALTHLCHQLRCGPVVAGLVLSPSRGFTAHGAKHLR